MRITNVGYNYRHAANFCINRPFGSGDYILVIIKTEAFFCLGGQRLVVPPNNAIIFKKGTPQLYGAVNSEYVNDWIHFDMDESEERFITDLGIPFDTIITLYDINALLSLIKNIFFERYSQNLHKEAAMKRYFELILLKISENMNQQHTEHEHPYYESFYNLRNEIRLVPQNRWTVDEISKKLNLSRSYLQHLYKLFFNTSIISDIQRGTKESANVRVIEKREDAIRWVIAHHLPGDTILLAGKGHEDYEIDRWGKHPFSEKAIIAECVENLRR